MASCSTFSQLPNAGHELLPEAGATEERTLEAVGCTPWFGPDSASGSQGSCASVPDVPSVFPAS
jgi:hypothetical protein